MVEVAVERFSSSGVVATDEGVKAGAMGSDPPGRKARRSLTVGQSENREASTSISSSSRKRPAMFKERRESTPKSEKSAVGTRSEIWRPTSSAIMVRARLATLSLFDLRTSGTRRAFLGAGAGAIVLADFLTTFGASDTAIAGMERAAFVAPPGRRWSSTERGRPWNYL